jgi:GAF domain-containing protein
MPDPSLPGTPLTAYAGRMGELARNLRSQRTSLLTLQHAVTAACEQIGSCDAAAISLAHRPSGGPVEVVTRASYGDDGRAERADRLQGEYAEGPCVDDVWQRPLARADDLLDASPWPRWGPVVARELGIRSVLCVQLFTHEHRDLGVLQLHSSRPAAFGPDDEDEVAGIAVTAAVALGAMAHYETLELGMARRTVIAQATGILMERYGLDRHAAFEVLRRTSQETRRKVHDLATDLVEGRSPSGL